MKRIAAVKFDANKTSIEKTVYSSRRPEVMMEISM
jgi:hypothetical protein